MEKISDLITPRERKKVEFYKKLSVEDWWILRRARFNEFIITLALVYYLTLKPHLDLLIASLNIGNSIELSAAVGVYSLGKTVLEAIIFGAFVFIILYVVDYFVFGFNKKARRVRNKIKKALK